MFNRRFFLKALSVTPLIASSGSLLADSFKKNERVSLSQWCFHRGIFGDSRSDYNKFISTLHSSPDDVLQGSISSKEITTIAQTLKINYIDLVNILFFGHAMDKPWLDDFKIKANDSDTKFQVLMCDELGSLGASELKTRNNSIEAHMPWLETAAYLGCKQIRVNANGNGTYLQQLDQCAESLAMLSTMAETMNIEVLVENHGYASNNGAWLAMLIEHTNHSNLGVFTDLDNFFMGGWNHKPERRYDRLQGIIDLAPYTRGVSVKAHDFNEKGKETTIDYEECFNALAKANFNGFYSAEYEGKRLSELEGTKATISSINIALEKETVI